MSHLPFQRTLTILCLTSFFRLHFWRRITSDIIGICCHKIISVIPKELLLTYVTVCSYSSNNSYNSIFIFSFHPLSFSRADASADRIYTGAYEGLGFNCNKLFSRDQVFSSRNARLPNATWRICRAPVTILTCLLPSRHFCQLTARQQHVQSQLETSSERAEERPDNIRMLNASVRVSADNGFTARWRFPPKPYVNAFGSARMRSHAIVKHKASGIFVRSWDDWRAEGGAKVTKRSRRVWRDEKSRMKHDAGQRFSFQCD